MLEYYCKYSEATQKMDDFISNEVVYKIFYTETLININHINYKF